jgi:hypothetical protein
MTDEGRYFKAVVSRNWSDAIREPKAVRSMTHDGRSAGILRCNVPTISASSVAARDIRWVGQPPSVGRGRVSRKRTGYSRNAWVGGAFVSLMPSAVDSPERRKH